MNTKMLLSVKGHQPVLKF